MAGRDARAFGQGLLAAHRIEDVELFPKQDRLGGGPGSLIRLPFGIHRRSGRRYGFLGPDGHPLAATLREQIEALDAAQRVPEVAFEAYRSFVPLRPPSPRSERKEASGDLLSERVKASVATLDFVGRYVELKPTASGALGRCPFHDDQHASFAVNEAGDYWHCFAGCGGGSIIDFWMKWREVHGQDPDFVATLAELVDMLL